MMVELEEKVSQLENWSDGKGLIVRGAAGTFCSGSDLNAVRALSNPEVGEREQRYYITSLTFTITFNEGICLQCFFFLYW